MIKKDSLSRRICLAFLSDITLTNKHQIHISWLHNHLQKKKESLFTLQHLQMTYELLNYKLASKVGLGSLKHSLADSFMTHMHIFKYFVKL